MDQRDHRQGAEVSLNAQRVWGASGNRCALFESPGLPDAPGQGLSAPAPDPTPEDTSEQKMLFAVVCEAIPEL